MTGPRAYQAPNEESRSERRVAIPNQPRTVASRLPNGRVGSMSLLALQRTAGNAAVAAMLADRSQVAQREPDAGVAEAQTRPVGPGPGVRASGDVSVSAGSTMTAEATLREVYSRSARLISEAARDMVRAGTSVEEAARWAVNARNELKVAIRQQGSALVRGLAEARNMRPPPRGYGNKVGPSYDDLIREGKTPEDIIGKAGRSATKVNRVAQVARVGGWFLIAIDVAIVTWEVIEAEPDDRLRTGVRGAGGIGGALGGGWAGMKLGGAIGSLVGPEGTAVGALIGGVAGAIIGGFAGRELAGAAYDKIEEELTTPDLDAQMSAVDAAEDAYIRSGQ